MENNDKIGKKNAHFVERKSYVAISSKNRVERREEKGVKRPDDVSKKEQE